MKKFAGSVTGKIVLHSLCWIAFFTLPQLTQPDHLGPPMGKPHFAFPEAMLVNGILLTILFFYFHAYVLVPKLFSKRKFIWYGFAIALTVVIAHGISMFVNYFFNDNSGFLPFRGILAPAFITLILSFAYRMVLDHFRNESLRKEKENEQLKTELSFLKSQVAPHFLFNVMNSFVSLARKKSDDLEPMLLKLSDLLKYMLYESDTDKIELEKEISYIEAFIELQKMRFGNRADIHVLIDKNPATRLTIAPMLLLPFVENAFKHGTNVLNPEIIIQLHVANNRITFIVENTYSKNSPEEEHSGIGLQNVKRRLEILYPGMHQLDIHQDSARYRISLHLSNS